MNRQSFNVPWLKEIEIAQRAQAFLAQTHPSHDIPVPIELIIERQGIHIIPVPNLHRDFDLDGFSALDWSAIYVDQWFSEERETRYRFTLAHEIGHVILHRSLFNVLSPSLSSIDTWIKFQKEVPESVYSRMEWQAYMFAGLALVPSKPLLHEFDAACVAVRPLLREALAKNFPLADARDYAWKTVTRRIAAKFIVSSEVINRRLTAQGISPSNLPIPASNQ